MRIFNIKMKKFFQKIFNFVKSHLIVSAIGIIVLPLLYFLALPRTKTAIQGPKAKYETTKVKKGDIRSTISASGKIEAENQVTLKFQTSGKLAWVGVKKGDRVKKWQAIASLDKRELEKTLKKELNDYLEERWDFEGDRETYHVTTDDLEKYTLTNAVRRILEKAQFDLNNTVIDLEIADLALKLATITSPIDGIVTEIGSPIAGVNITPATAEFTIANPEVMVFKAKIDEADIGKIKEGQKAIVILDAYEDQEFEGTVAKIDFASTTTSGGGTAFSTEISLPANDNLLFKVGMNGDAEIIIEEKADVLHLPQGTIKEKDGRTYVEIIEGRKIKEIEVETGLSTDTQTEILSGLEKDQEVITRKKEKSS